MIVILKMGWKLLGGQRKPRQWRMVFYLAILLGIAGWKFLPRPWHPTVTLERPHYTIYSTASNRQTDDTAHAMELLYESYSNAFHTLPAYTPQHAKLKVKLFKDRKEFRWINPNLGWAEAFYREPYCRAYFSAEESNPYHWMLHEATHQLNNEVAHVELAKWLEEGLAEYVSTSRMSSNTLAISRVDVNTYPVWWIDDLATAPTLEQNLQNHSVIPLRAIVTNRGGPSMRSAVNLYYLHWWSLTHFIYETPKYRPHALTLMARGGDSKSFEALIGPIDQIQSEWHAYVRRLKSVISGHDPDFLRTGDVSVK
ncbi:MAG TPA: hypothetical protein VMZ27_00550 [Candidatus Saccharimonadales bacterium]|nr:hypothetical protein [Candidatus Saccharimonadales bacterium]